MVQTFSKHTPYQDSGCEVAESCLACSLSVCRYEVHGGLATLARQKRNKAVQDSRVQGGSIATLCRSFRLSRRTVFRILAMERS